ncbi:MAG TPA: queuosine salvage family protein, partial [Ktedonobacteraceae bacterium]|nr:queuosine salvage family protein [Ktedonobacteraceae bacterium]
HYGALIYHPDLAKKIDEQMLLTAGSIEEVEIRAATIWASELLRREIVQLTEQTITAAEIDQLLWHLGQDATAMRPYHRVYTIYY